MNVVQYRFEGRYWIALSYMPVKILICTDSPVQSTGLAEALRGIFETLLDQYPGNYTLSQVGFCHGKGVANPRWEVFGTSGTDGLDLSTSVGVRDQYGQETFSRVFDEFRPDIVFGFGDPWVIAHLTRQHIRSRASVVLYVNVDGIPCLPLTESALLAADRIVATTHFGRHAIQEAAISLKSRMIDVIYHPTDLQRFRPCSAHEKRELRTSLTPAGVSPSAFILGWVGVDQWRKQIWLPYKVISHIRKGGYCECRCCGRVSLMYWDPAGKCFPEDNGRPLHDNNPSVPLAECCHCGSVDIHRGKALDDVVLWLHTTSNEDLGWSLPQLHRTYDLREGVDIVYTPGISSTRVVATDKMPQLYRLWDALLYLSGGEGFGLPVWEAISCGIPVVYSDYSGHAELLRQSGCGLSVSGILQPEHRSGILRMVAHADRAVDQVLKLYRTPALRCDMGRAGAEWVAQYQKESIASKWHELFNEHRTSWRLKRNVYGIYKL